MEGYIATMGKHGYPLPLRGWASQSFLGVSTGRFNSYDSFVSVCTIFSDESKGTLFDLRPYGYPVSYHDHDYEVMAAYG